MPIFMFARSLRSPDQVRLMILQFGAGNFLRAFVDLFVSESGFDEIMVVQSTGRERAEALNRAGGSAPSLTPRTQKEFSIPGRLARVNPS